MSADIDQATSKKSDVIAGHRNSSAFRAPAIAAGQDLSLVNDSRRRVGVVSAVNHDGPAAAILVVGRQGAGVLNISAVGAKHEIPLGIPAKPGGAHDASIINSERVNVAAGCLQFGIDGLDGPGIVDACSAARFAGHHRDALGPGRLQQDFGTRRHSNRALPRGDPA